MNMLEYWKAQGYATIPSADTRDRGKGLTRAQMWFVWGSAILFCLAVNAFIILALSGGIFT